MIKQVGRYSKYLRPFTVLLDLVLLNLIAGIILPFGYISPPFHVFVSVVWIVLSWITKYYDIYRFTKLIQIGSKVLKQFALFTIFCFAYIGFISGYIAPLSLLSYIAITFVCITFLKYGIFSGLKYFRRHFRGNQRKVVIIGQDPISNQLATFFQEEKDYGYDCLRQFPITELEEALQYCREGVDEIYLSLNKIESKQIKRVILFTDNFFMNLKYIPSRKEILSNSAKIQYYGFIPVIPERKTPLEIYYNRLIKRTFDIIFSIFVIVFVMSWLFPIIAILIKLESKGPVLFKQKRNGIYFEEFYCYKFRSMIVNVEADTHQVIKNDKRITKLGAFLRKSSIDEMPQFFNVLIGNMSVCGPRPHMVNLTNKYVEEVERFKLRHFIKPGITGMAQTHGYRGEIESQRDIINRVKYDVFYIESWSLLLDLKIIYLTVKNAVMGDNKAY